MSENPLPVLKVSNLTKRFNLEAGFFSKNKNTVYAVNNVTFEVPRGHTYGIVGESGCGKTTTARMLVQLYKQSSGQIEYFSKDGNSVLLSNLNKKELKKYREKVKYIFQDPAKSLNPRMNVFDILTAGLRYSSLWNGRQDAIRLCEKIIQEVGLNKEDIWRHPSEFSGGQRQRISIARGLIMNPELLVCDEVVSALDVSIQAQILKLLQELKEKRNLSYIFITHDLRVACYFCDTIGVMYKGVLVEEGPAATMYKDAVHPYTKLLFNGALGKTSNSNIEIKTTLDSKEADALLANEFIEVSKGHKVRLP